MLTADFLKPITTLPCLTELHLGHIEFSMPKADKSTTNGLFAPLPTLPTVKRLLIYLANKDHFNADLFCKQVSSVFVGLEELTLKCGSKLEPYDLLTPMHLIAFNNNVKVKVLDKCDFSKKRFDRQQ